jgi:cyanophycin synthetase
MVSREGVRLVELRVLEGPNLYFTRPAIKLTVAVPAWMGLSEERARRLAERMGLPGATRAGGGPGPPESDHRRRFVARMAAHVTRRQAAATRMRPAVRARPGPEVDQIVVAFPWRRRDAAEALGREVAETLRAVLSSRRSFEDLIEAAAGRLARFPLGPRPTIPEPAIPVVMVTGTNGKTSTVRLLTHLIRSAGLSVAYTSTDGVYLNGRQVEQGDYSGPGGAAMALSQPGVEGVVLEVARGGILLKGIGTGHNDVAVVTNISADHLGLHGIRTLDQLAEVKATITRITKPEGWDVLNADDPRVLAMRRGARGRPFLFSLDPDHPAIRQVLTEGGRALAPLDGKLVLMSPGPVVRDLLKLEEVPVTLAGISSQYTQNAMAAAAAALGLGLSPEDVIEGLRTFVLDPERNPGRANLFELDRRVLVVDYAHNEAGMEGLIEICRGLRKPGSRIWLALGSAGDRTDEIMHGMAYIAARGADHVSLVEMLRYLRGSTREHVLETLRGGAIDGGASEVPDFADELTGLRWMLRRSEPGDVLAITALAQRPEIFAYLRRSGARRIGPGRCRQLVRRARAAA